MATPLPRQPFSPFQPKTREGVPLRRRSKKQAEEDHQTSVPADLNLDQLPAPAPPPRLRADPPRTPTPSDQSAGTVSPWDVLLRCWKGQDLHLLHDIWRRGKEHTLPFLHRLMDGDFIISSLKEQEPHVLIPSILSFIIFLWISLGPWGVFFVIMVVAVISLLMKLGFIPRGSTGGVPSEGMAHAAAKAFGEVAPGTGPAVASTSNGQAGEPSSVAPQQSVGPIHPLRRDFSLHGALVAIAEVRVVEKDFASYRLQVHCKGQVWSVWRRFSEFVDLRASLVLTQDTSPSSPESTPGVGNEKRKTRPFVPSLPPKTVFSRLDQRFLNERMEKLTVFLKEVLKQRSLCDNVHMRAFLDVSPMAPFDGVQRRLHSPPVTAVGVRTPTFDFEKVSTTDPPNGVNHAEPSSSAEATAADCATEGPQIPFTSQPPSMETPGDSPVPKPEDDTSTGGGEGKVSSSSSSSLTPPVSSPPTTTTTTATTSPTANGEASIASASPSTESSSKRDRSPSRVDQEQQPQQQNGGTIEVESQHHEGVLSSQSLEAFVKEHISADDYYDAKESNTFWVRGKTYMTDNVKVSAGPAMGRLLCTAVFKIHPERGREDHIVSQGKAAALLQEMLALEGQPFIFLVNFQVPGDPPLSMIHFYALALPDRGSCPAEAAPFFKTFEKFINFTNNP